MCSRHSYCLFKSVLFYFDIQNIYGVASANIKDRSSHYIMQAIFNVLIKRNKPELLYYELKDFAFYLAQHSAMESL